MSGSAAGGLIDAAGAGSAAEAGSAAGAVPSLPTLGAAGTFTGVVSAAVGCCIAAGTSPPVAGAVAGAAPATGSAAGMTAGAAAGTSGDESAGSEGAAEGSGDGFAAGVGAGSGLDAAESGVSRRMGAGATSAGMGAGAIVRRGRRSGRGRGRRLGWRLLRRGDLSRDPPDGAVAGAVVLPCGTVGGVPAPAAPSGEDGTAVSVGSPGAASAGISAVADWDRPEPLGSRPPPGSGRYGQRGAGRGRDLRLGAGEPDRLARRVIGGPAGACVDVRDCTGARADVVPNGTIEMRPDADLRVVAPGRAATSVSASGRAAVNPLRGRDWSLSA